MKFRFLCAKLERTVLDHTKIFFKRIYEDMPGAKNRISSYSLKKKKKKDSLLVVDANFL